MSDMRELIISECDKVKEIILDKNEAYGNSAANPVKIFSKINSVEQINIRIDDKLSRIARGNTYGDEDTELDLIGYLILKRIVVQTQKQEESKNVV